jgi:hypothetical protein
MAKQYYFPANILAQIALLKLFVSKLVTAYQTKYNINAQQQADMANSAVYFDWLSQCHEAINQYDHAMTQYMDSIMNTDPTVTHTLPILTLPAAPAVTPSPGGMSRFKDIVQSIKNNPNYSVEDGKNLGIEGAETNTDENALQPVLKAQVVGNNVQISSPKHRTQGTEIWVDRGTGYQLIGFCSSSKFTDPTPIGATATTLKYKGRYHLHGEAVGQWSEEVKVNVGG